MIKKIVTILTKIKRFTNIYLILAVICLITSLPVNSKVFFLEADFYQDKTQEKTIILGKGEIISSDTPIIRVAVSDPGIVDLQVLNEKQVFVRAKQLGISTLLAWEKDKSTPSRFDISVWPDIGYLNKQLKDLDENITTEYIPPINNVSSDSSQAQQSQSTEIPTTGASSLQGGGSTSPASSTSSTSQPTSGKIILKGEVKNAEVIARALQIAGAYVGDQGIKIISQPGGQVVDGLSGKYDIYSNSDFQTGQSTQGSATSFGARDPIRFTSNRYANLSRGTIVTTQRGAVVSFLTVKDSPQVSVAIRFYEISRNVSRNLGFNSTFGGSTLQGGTFVGGNGISQPFGGVSSLSNVSEFMSGQQGAAPELKLTHGSIAGGSALIHSIGQGVTGVIFNPDNGIGAIIQALQVRGEIKTLAEPTLVIANGEPASFLAGGEVPILRSVFTAGGASTDVTYEPFGIRFTLLPTVTSKDKVYLQLIPEIRDIDNDLSNFVAAPGSTTVRPPAFRTRRTQTQVELESGQAFAISGLLREDNTRNLQKVPGIGDIPILGTLFRSKSFRKGETELLVVVSPQIVKPTTPDKISQLTTPDVPYNDFDQLAPLRPFVKPQDEKGPDMKEPLDAGKYNNQKNIDGTNNKSQSLNEKEQVSIKTPSVSSQKVEIERNTLESKKIDKKVKEKVFLSKSLDNKKRLEETKEEKLIKKQQELKDMWEKELARYTQAKEAMKLARENKL